MAEPKVVAAVVSDPDPHSTEDDTTTEPVSVKAVVVATKRDESEMWVFTKILMTIALILITILGISVGFHWKQPIGWETLVIAFLISVPTLTVAVFLLMRSDSPHGKIGKQAWIGLVLVLGIGFYLGNLLLPKTIKNYVSSAFGQATDSPIAKWNGNALMIDFEDSAGTARQATKVLVTAEYDPSSKIELSDWKILYVFFEDKETGANTRSYRVLKKP